MKTRIATLSVYLGGGLCVLATALFWQIVTKADAEAPRQLTIVTIGLFSTGLLLIGIAPLVAGAMSASDGSGRSRLESGRRDGEAWDATPGRRFGLAQVLIWIVLIEFVVIAALA